MLIIDLRGIQFYKKCTDPYEELTMSYSFTESLSLFLTDAFPELGAEWGAFVTYEETGV